ncbi:MAG: hypothetical protein LAN62_00205 [Acidobacteriia bacterium]|nr:hypothetical protein [Terriglobia bacterium]
MGEPVGSYDEPEANRAEADLLVEDFEQRTLDAIPGRFSRLIYLASLRDHNTGRYHHYGLEARYSSEAVDEGLRHCHAEAFADLLSLSLQEQTQDLLRFFESLKAERARLVQAWQQLRAYQILPPQNCHPLARELFSKNVEVILEVLRQTDLWELLDDPHRDPHDLP